MVRRLQVYEPNKTDDQVSGGVGQDGAPGGSRVRSCLFLEVLQTRFHAASAFRHAGVKTVLQGRLPRHGANRRGQLHLAAGAGAQEDPALFDLEICPRSTPKKGAFDVLQEAVFSIARAGGLIDRRPEASIDATGLESSYISRHFLRRQGRMKRHRHWTKLTLVCDHGSHLIAALRVCRGPSNDAPDFAPAMREAVRYLPIHRLLADAAYDAEAHHRLCREELGIRSTVIPINPRGPGPVHPKGRYRRMMHRRFPKRIYGRRWHAESVMSRFKRHLGSALDARTRHSRVRECRCRVLTHNLMVL